MRRVLGAYHDALDQGENFDFVIEPGTKIEGYRRITRVSGGADDGQ